MLHEMDFFEFELREEEANLFIRDGFRTGRICLPGLGLWISLKPTQYFKFDGVVQDMGEYLKSLPGTMKSHVDQYIGDPKYRTAFNTFFVLDNYRGGFMVVRSVSPRADIANVWHEAAELAVQFGQSRALEAHFRFLGYPVSLAGLETHDVGNAASLIGARVSGFEIENLLQNQDPESWLVMQRLGLIV
jgi:hypothetical protein